MTKRMSAYERLVSRLIDDPSGCLVYSGARDRYGYGTIGIGQDKRLAHRTAWEQVNGPIPDGLYVLHRCDNRPCCRIEHLYLGTQKDNMRDRIERGNANLPTGAQHWTRKGERRGKVKLRLEDVQAIRHAYASENTTQDKLARAYGVSRSQIHNVVTGKQWWE